MNRMNTVNPASAASSQTGPAAMRRAEAFLRRHGMYYEQIDPEAELQKLMDAMEADFRQEGQTGRMIPTWIGDYHAPGKGGKAVTVIDIGGTNVRSAVITVGEDGAMRIGNMQAFRTPGVLAPTDTAGFYGQIVDGVRDNLVTDEIGICFSLATIPQKDRDAVMVAGGKQIMITDMLGKKVGECFREAMRAGGLSCSARITVVNDTVAAALGGQAENPAGSSRQERPAGNGTGHESRHSRNADETGGYDDCGHNGSGGGSGNSGYSGYIGFIYGTGINMCYREKTGEWINTEAAVYDTFLSGDLDDEFDSGLIDPGCDRLEKMVSGGYLGGLMTTILDAAAREGVIDSSTMEAIHRAVEKRNHQMMNSGKGTLSARDLSDFLCDPEGGNLISAACSSREERQTIAAICDAVTHRSAWICAVVITAGLLRCGAKAGRQSPVFITAEGSTFYKLKGFREKLHICMDELAGRDHGLHFEFHNVPDVILKGIAVACLSD